MNDLLVSLSDNVLKLTYWSIDGFGGFSRELPTDIVENSTIVDIEKFTEIFSATLTEFLPKKAKRDSLNFLVDPQDVEVFFISVNKNDGTVDDQIIAAAREKLGDSGGLEALYFSYKKIAPFTYQFVGINQHKLENYLQVANSLGIPLKSITPWVLLLPKLVNNSQPSIFVSKNDNGKQVVALSDLNGIYFTKVFTHEQTDEELTELVKNISLYKRTVPIDKIYTVNYGSFSLDPKYEVLPLKVPGNDTEEFNGYETHLLFHNVIESSPQILLSCVNLLNLLPVPATVKRSVPALKAVAFVLPLVLLIGTGLFLKQRVDLGGSSAEPAQSPEVLSEVTETLPATITETEPAEVVELNKEELKVRVENATNIPGLAARTRDFLVQLGYSVVGIGDSIENGRETTLVKVKDSKIDYKEVLLDDLDEEYMVEVEGGLAESSEFDVLITAGEK